MLTINVKFAGSYKIESLNEPMKKIIRKTLQMDEHDIVQVKFAFDEKKNLTTTVTSKKTKRDT